MENIILVLISGVMVLVGVYLGYRLGLMSIGEDIFEEYEPEPEEVPDSLVKKIFSGEYFKGDEEPKINVEEKLDKDRRHAFYD